MQNYSKPHLKFSKHYSHCFNDFLMKRINHQPLITFQMAQVMFAHYNSENYINNIVYV